MYDRCDACIWVKMEEPSATNQIADTSGKKTNSGIFIILGWTHASRMNMFHWQVRSQRFFPFYHHQHPFGISLPAGAKYIINFSFDIPGAGIYVQGPEHGLTTLQSQFPGLFWGMFNGRCVEHWRLSFHLRTHYILWFIMWHITIYNYIYRGIFWNLCFFEFVSAHHIGKL